MNALSVGLATVLVFSGLLSCQSATPPPKSPVSTSVGHDTLLSSGDVFDVRVYKEEELSGSFRVSAEGMIDFPLIGRVEVAGKNPDQIAELISEKLKNGEILKAPQVSVFVKDYASKRVSVTGAVNKSGTFSMTSGLTVVQAVSLAGGFTPLASRNATVVTRSVNGKLQRFKVRAEAVQQGSEEDFLLQAGDIIYVPQRIF